MNGAYLSRTCSLEKSLAPALRNTFTSKYESCSVVPFELLQSINNGAIVKKWLLHESRDPMSLWNPLVAFRDNKRPYCIASHHLWQVYKWVQRKTLLSMIFIKIVVLVRTGRDKWKRYFALCWLWHVYVTLIEQGVHCRSLYFGYDHGEPAQPNRIEPRSQIFSSTCERP